MEAQKLFDRYKLGERDFPGVDLSYTTWKGCNLSEINLEGADLSNSDFQEMTFDHANLKNCNFSGSTFQSVQFVNANLTNACFIKSDLQTIDFSGADLTGAQFEESSRFDDINMAKAIIKNVNFSGSKMFSINWSYLDLEGCNFSGIYGFRINLAAANCKKCNFKMANLEEAILRETCLEGANFKQANIKTANLMKAKVKNASFVGANLTDANLYLTNYQEAQIIGAIMPDGEVYDPDDYSIVEGGESGGNSTKAEFINTENAPKSPNSPHQAVIINGCIYIAGQIAIDPRLNIMLCDDEITDQTRRVMDNIGAILTAAGVGWSKVVKTTIFMVDLQESDRMNSVYSSYFTDGNLPICTCVAVSQLPENARVQIECIATL
ncbi:MAG: Rid family detoxifying hydrolase [Limnospira sp. PMC 1286.21]|uniref:Rid family detoxifying hydrolase n=1 Tax=unclassified Limnospira TaxID=2642885 RepID=UPI0028E0A7EB|nr:MULTISPECIES: Rid family detoxifying hydrolase [unclassified Limnospira]MDT9203917.1 Rid family detoxifying hydrolase [Limnospira sp. PMC 1243.20]MDT9212864.1 Rid family detoxifying hydrolase [Limnospira sp. PMC 1256.20]MDT9244733.1 Rid family detoxifying hydrolase [Limnospira sp. PMC 1249.20]MDT9258536.1 Rid family detoxifying hydrolase [Limnospira sp. PMC 1236.20]MDT9319909.1 Rid family detoxifying hydrolase [Limnospira sp. PMC 1290.21]